MQRWLAAAATQVQTAGAAEIVAVLLGFAYVLLAIRRRRLCWLAGGVSTAIYVVVFAAARLYLQSALQVLYVLLSAYGWWAWSAAGAGAVAPRRWSVRGHLLAAAAVLGATAVTVPALQAWSDAAAPFGDALGTWASLAATWMLARRVAAAWLWWIVVDVGLAGLFASQGLAFTAVLYLAFAALAVAGWFAWRRAEAGG